MNLRDVAVLVEAAKSGSLAEAARRLGIPAMAASRRLAALEAEMGSRLMHRTTVASSLTAEGQEFLPFAEAMLANEEDARAALRPPSTGATGLLRVTTSAAFGRKIVIPMIPHFMAANPDVRVDLLMSDTIIDIVGAGFDVAIRIAPLRDSGLIARRLAANPRALYATPAYLERRGAPKLLDDLEHHQCLTFSNATHWPIVHSEGSRRVRIRGRFSANSMEGLHAACLADLGIAMLSLWDTRLEVATKALVRIDLSDGEPEPLAIWAVYPTTLLIPPKVRCFVEMLEALLRKE